MKLILENWRKFIKEDIGYFGNSFVEFKNRVDAGEHPLKVAREILDPVGKGSTRIVFGFPDNKTHLLKVVNVEIIGDEEPYPADFRNPMTGFTRKHKTVSNENEADLKMQQRYSEVFPRTYEYAEDYSWILAERVQPIDKSALAHIFNIPEHLLLLENRKEYVKLMKMTAEFVNSGEALSEAADPTFVLDPDRNPPRNLDDQASPDIDWDDHFLKLQDNEREMVKDILADSHNRQLFRAVAALGIPPRELTPKNLGISKFGGDHLVILDASLWEYES